MAVNGIIAAVIIGAIIGILGRMVAPGRQKISLIVTILVGIVAALVGTALAKVLEFAETPGTDWIEIFIQVAVAALGVSLASGSKRGRRR